MGQINELLEDSLTQLKKMIEVNNVIGEPIEYRNITIIPITSIHIAFLSGGADINQNQKNNQNPLFGGATSGGVSISPCGFIVINGSSVEFVTVENKSHIYEKIIDYLANAFDKGKTLFKNNVEIKEV